MENFLSIFHVNCAFKVGRSADTTFALYYIEYCKRFTLYFSTRVDDLITFSSPVNREKDALMIFIKP